MFKIIFFDIDGTLVNNDKILSKNTIKAVHQLKQNGLDVVLATGRAPHHIISFSEQLGIRSYVSLNGAYVCYEGKIIQSTALEKMIIEKLLELSVENNHPLVFSNNEKTVSNQLNHPEVIESFDSLKLDYVPGYQPNFWKETEIYQVMLYCKEHEETIYRESIPELQFVRWHPLSLDVMPAHLSKATGIKAMLDYLGLTPKEAIAFGDGLNDKEMLSFVGMGVAMENAHHSLIPYAKMVTKSVDEDGIIYALCKFGLI